MNGRPPQVQARLEAELIARTPLYVSAIVRFELRYGARKSAFPERNLARIDEFFTANFSILAFDDEDAAVAGDIRATLEKMGTPIGAYDVQFSMFALGCGSSSNNKPTTPASQVVNMTITGTSGSITQSSVVAITVN